MIARTFDITLVFVPESFVALQPVAVDHAFVVDILWFLIMLIIIIWLFLHHACSQTAVREANLFVSALLPYHCIIEMYY